MFYIAVMHRVMVNVIHCCPKMTFRPDGTLKAVMPHLATPTVVFGVPSKRGASMETAQAQTQISNLIGFYENMVMVRQNTPCIK
jgi:hypothetical protein